MRQTRTTAKTCHCGALFRGCDHCYCCGCEQYEATCERTCPAPRSPDHDHDEVCR